MKKIGIVLIAFLIQVSSFAQKLQDNLDYKVSYQLTYKLDSTDLGNSKSEYMILYIGNNFSAYSSHAKTMAHSNVANGFSGHSSKNALTAFHYLIIKSRESKKMYNALQIPKIPGDHFFYEESKELFNWQIGIETKTIKGYHCQKAASSFAGRDYVAWFAPEIPIPDGPYKFNGLPGLILEIEDTEKHYVFSFIGLEKQVPAIPFEFNLNKLIKAEKKDLQELWYRYRKDPFTYANNPNVKIDPEVHKKYVNAFTEMLEKENNPIELK